MKSSTSLRYAGFAKRLGAFALDYLLIGAYIVVLATTMFGISRVLEFFVQAITFPTNPVIGDLIAFFTLVLPVSLYFTLQENSSRQATWGKRKVGIRVVNATGGRLTRKQAFVRSLVKLLPWQIGHTCLFQTLAVTVMPPVVIAGYGLLYALVGVYIASALISKNIVRPMIGRQVHS